MRSTMVVIGAGPSALRDARAGRRGRPQLQALGVLEHRLGVDAVER